MLCPKISGLLDKTTSKLLSSVLCKNMAYGRNIHSILENIDFNNPDYTNLNEFEKNCIDNFLSTGILDNSINLYKEYEFIYMEDNTKYHGIIDLLIEYDNEFKIVDYKLKNITDEAYIKQLTGYKKYIESISTKPVSIYLYSILDGKLEKID